MLTLLLVVYVAVALCNLSIVQSYLGTAVSRHFSQEWGGTVRISSLHVTPLGHVKLRDILLVNPSNDTIFRGDVIDCLFDHFPVSGEGLTFSRVRISNAYYHFGMDSSGINLNYIFDYYARPKEPKETKPFVVCIKRVLFNNIHYKQDIETLHSEYYSRYSHGVDISHMDFRHIDGNVKDLRVEGFHVDCRVVHLECEERSGFHLRDLSADVKVSDKTVTTRNMDLTTDNSHLLCDVELDYNGWNSFSERHVFDSVIFAVTLRDGTSVGLRDAAYWAPSLWGMDNLVTIAGEVSGPLSRLQIDKMSVAVGDRTRLRIDGSIVGLPHIARTEFNLDVHAPCIATDDVVAFHQPIQPFFSLPHPLQQLGDVELEAVLRGSLQAGDVDLSMNSDIGPVTAQATVGYDDSPRDLHYNLQLHSDRLHVAKLTDDKRLASTAIQLNVNGKGIDPDEMSLDGDIALRNTVLQHYRLAPLNVQLQLDHRQISLQGDIDDPLAALQMEGSGHLAGDSTTYQAHLTLQHCQLSQLLGKDDSSHAVTISTTADIDLQGFDIDRMRGTIALRDNYLTIGKEQGPVDDLVVTLDEENQYKTLRLQSAIAQATLSGYIDYARIPQLGQLFLQRYLPVDMATSRLTEADSNALLSHAFNIDVVWNDPHHTLNLLLPDLHIAPGSQLHGSYNHTESMKLVARSDSIRVGSLRMLDLALSGHPVGENYSAICDIERIDMSGLPLFTNLRITSSNNSSAGRLRLNWDDDENSIRDQGDIGILVHHDANGQHRMQVTDPTFYLRGKRWDIDCDDILLAQKTFIMPHLSIHSDVGAINATAEVTPDGEASASANFEHFSIDLLDSLLLASKHILIEGVVDGQIHTHRTSTSATPYLLADLTVDSCSVNNQPLGKVGVKSALDLERQWLDINATSTLQRETGTLQPVAANGHITLDKKPQIDLNVHFDNFALATVAPLLRSFASRVDGTLSSDIQIVGNLSRPKVEGMAHIYNGLLEVDYTGVTYRCNDSVALTNGRVSVNNFHIYDPQDNLIIANGGIDYSDPDDLQIDLALQSDRITVLNTKAHGSDPYGTLVAALNGTVTGRKGVISIDASAQTRPGSDITVPVDNKLSATEQDYIHFVVPNAARTETTVQNAGSSNIPSINLALTITPDLTLHVPMDFNQLDVNIRATGAGNLQLRTGAGHNTNLYGSYEFASGTLALSMLSLVEKNFTIEPGSSLIFPGDINRIQFDVSAVYALRASIASLTGNETDNSQRNIPVQSIINLAGSLQEPNITFDIRLPNVDASTAEEVFTYIDRSNQRDMLNQTISLLAMGQFYSNANSSQTASTATTSGYGAMVKSAGYLVSQMVTVVDIDFGYTAATDLTTEQFDIDISKSWDRFYFESTLGYGGESRNLNSDADAHAINNLVGDILVGYRLNPRLHLFVFNRTNTNDYTRIELPYKQGFGLKYTRDFNRWGDLFHRIK